MEKDFNKWWRANVSYRGVDSNSGKRSGMLGDGLYSAALSNKKMASGYGEVFFIINARPKKPIKFQNLNTWEIWIQNNRLNNQEIREVVIKAGYDGVEITGREYVSYFPENAIMFKTKEKIKEYYYAKV